MSRGSAGDDGDDAAKRGPSALPGAVGAPVKLIALLDSHPRLQKGLTALGDALLFNGVLSDAERELLILRTGAQRSPYVLAGHLPIAAAAGLTDAEIEGICGGTAAGPFDPRRDALRRACDELLEHGELNRDTRAELENGRGTTELLEIVAVVGFYRIIATITRLYGLAPEPPPPGGG